MADCRNLEYLRLAKFYLKDEDLKVLPKLESLAGLMIEGGPLVYDPDRKLHGLTDESIGYLGALEKLERLYISGKCDFSDEFARGISALPKLTSLTVPSSEFTDHALQ